MSFFSGIYKTGRFKKGRNTYNGATSKYKTFGGTLSENTLTRTRNAFAGRA